MDFRKSIDGLAALVELDIKVAVFDPVLFVFLNKSRNPDDPFLLKQLLEQMINERASDKGKIVHLEEEVALLRQRLFGRKTEQTNNSTTPQLPLFDEAESLAEPADEASEEEVAPSKHRGKRKPLPSDLPRVEVIHELPEHELTCACGCREHAIGEEDSEQLEIVPMQIRVIKHIRKVYGCRDCESAPVTADKPAQMIEKSMASPSVLAMLLTTQYVDGLPLHRFEKVLGRHVARLVISAGSNRNVSRALEHVDRKRGGG